MSLALELDSTLVWLSCGYVDAQSRPIRSRATASRRFPSWPMPEEGLSGFEKIEPFSIVVSVSSAPLLLEI
jgi:hypothetical protein